MSRQLRSRSMIQEHKRKPPIRNIHREINYMNQLVAFWGQKEEIKLPPLNVIEKQDFKQFKPYEVKFKMYQNCYAFNNLVHKEFEIIYVDSPEEAKRIDISIDFKVSIVDCLFGRSVFTKQEYPPSVVFYAGTIDKATSCLLHIENLPEHLISSSKTMRSIFYHYYLNYRCVGLPILKVYKPPFIFRAKQIIRFKTMAPTISTTLQNGLLSLLYITEQYVPLQSLIQYKMERGKLSYDQKLYIAIQIIRILQQLENQQIICIELNAESILITREGEFRISTMNLMPFLSTGQFKEQWSMYDDYEKVQSHLSVHRAKMMHPPEIRKKEPIEDYRAVNRYHLGMLLLQLHFDLPTINYIDEAKFNAMVIQLNPPRAKNMKSEQSQYSQNLMDRPELKSEESVEMNPLAILIRILLSTDPKARLKPLRDLLEEFYVVDEFSFIEDVEHFYQQEFKYYRAQSVSSKYSNKSAKIVLQPPIFEQPKIYQDQQPYQIPQISILSPEQIAQDRQQDKRLEEVVRQRNLIAEIMFNFYMYETALDHWQYLLPDVNECFGEDSQESSYILERIWMLAQHLGQDRVLDQIGEQYMRLRKQAVTTVKEQLQVAHMIEEQARIKAQMSSNLEAIKLFKQANQQFNLVKGKYNNSTAYNTIQIGLTYAKMLDMEKAKEHLEFGVYLFTKMDQSSVIPFLIASTWMIDDQEVVREEVDQMKFWVGLFSLGKFYFEFESHSKALGVFQAAMDLLKKIKEDQLYFDEFLKRFFTQLVQFYELMGRCFMDEDGHDEAFELVEEAIALKPDSLEIKGLILLKTEILVYKQRIADAISVFGLWVRKYQKIYNFTFDTANLLKEVGDLAFKFKDYKVAFSFYSEALIIFQNGKIRGLKQRQEINILVDEIEQNLRAIFSQQSLL